MNLTVKSLTFLRAQVYNKVKLGDSRHCSNASLLTLRICNYTSKPTDILTPNRPGKLRTRLEEDNFNSYNTEDKPFWHLENLKCGQGFQNCELR